MRQPANLRTSGVSWLFPAQGQDIFALASHA